MDCRSIYTSVGCNTTCQCVDWSTSDSIVFGANYSCVVLNRDHEGCYNVKSTYTKHTAKVNTVKWVKRENVEEFISGGDDNVAIVWRIGSRNRVTYLNGHTGSVTSVDSIAVSNTLYVATASADSTVRLWKVENEEYTLFQQISLGLRICTAVSFSLIPSSDQIILAFSSTDNKVQLYIMHSMNQRKFEPICKLTGHKNWVRGLDFVQIGESHLTLASASQDGSIRLWRISSEMDSVGSQGEMNRSLHHSGSENVEHCCSENNFELFVNLESIIQGHDDWVFDVHWHKKDGNLQLLSASIDKSMIVWQRIEDVWCETARLGVIGGNASGFYGGKFSGDGEFILGYGFMGSLCFWKKENLEWKQHETVEGHCSNVTDISWDMSGNYIISVSEDKTSLVHSIIKDYWKVVARPQIHGFALQCVASIDSSMYVSGAEEKVIRVFQAPDDFLRCHIPLKSYNYPKYFMSKVEKSTTVLEALGLSNKVLHTSNSPETNTYQLDEKLWPEMHKLYGHCHEISAIACSPDRKYLASAAKAFKPEDSYILIWDVSTWKIFQKISAHQLTITCLEFSKHNCYLLAVSRDRRWSLYKTTAKENNFKLVCLMGKTSSIHNRVIWCCDWSHDDSYFMTSSRDGKLNIWSATPFSQNKEPEIAAQMELKGESITACTFGCQPYFENNYLIAIGTERGAIKLLKFSNMFMELSTIFEYEVHHLTVRRLRFRPKSDAIQLASCSDDNFVRIYEFYFPKD